MKGQVLLCVKLHLTAWPVLVCAECSAPVPVLGPSLLHRHHNSHLLHWPFDQHLRHQVYVMKGAECVHAEWQRMGYVHLAQLGEIQRKEEEESGWR